MNFQGQEIPSQIPAILKRRKPVPARHKMPREGNCETQSPFFFFLGATLLERVWTTQPCPLHAVQEEKAFLNAVERTGLAEGSERTLLGGQGGTGHGVRLRDAKGGNSGSASATLPPLPTPGGDPGPHGGGSGHRPPGTPHLPPGEGAQPRALPGGGVSGGGGSRARPGDGREEPAAWAPPPARAARRPRPLAYRPRSPASAGTCSGSPHSPPGSGSAGPRPPTPAPWWD